MEELNQLNYTLIAKVVSLFYNLEIFIRSFLNLKKKVLKFFLCFVILRIRGFWVFFFFFHKEKTHARFAAILFIAPTETSMEGSSSEGTFFSTINI